MKVAGISNNNIQNVKRADYGKIKSSEKSFTGNLDVNSIVIKSLENTKLYGTTGLLIGELQTKISRITKASELAEQLQNELERATGMWLDATNRIRMFNNFMESNDAYFLSSAMKHGSIESRIETHTANEIAKESCNRAFRDKQTAEKALAELHKKVIQLEN